jgi:hypothetical protein
MLPRIEEPSWGKGFFDVYLGGHPKGAMGGHPGAPAAVGSAGGLSLSWSGWHSVHAPRFVLLLIGAAVVVSSLARPATAPSNHGWLLLAGGLLAGALAFYRLESPPGALTSRSAPSRSPRRWGRARRSVTCSGSRPARGWRYSVARWLASAAGPCSARGPRAPSSRRRTPWRRPRGRREPRSRSRPQAPATSGRHYSPKRWPHLILIAW